MLYDWRRCRVRALCRAASDAALALLAGHADALAADVGGSEWGRFVGGGAHTDAARRLVAGVLGGGGGSGRLSAAQQQQEPQAGQEGGGALHRARSMDAWQGACVGRSLRVQARAWPPA